MPRRPLNHHQRALARYWEAETNRLSARFRTLEAKLRAGRGARPAGVWGRFLDQHTETKGKLLTAQEKLADARRGRPVTGPSGVIVVYS